MKVHLSRLLLISSCFLPLACSPNNEPQIKRSKKQAAEPPPTTPGVPNQAIDHSDAFFLDAISTAANDIAVENVQATATVTAEIAQTPVNRMLDRMFDIADKDRSGNLSLAEFLEAPRMLRSIHKKHFPMDPTEEQKNRLTARLSADFEEFAGGDSLLDKDEAKNLVMYYAPLVNRIREMGFGCRDMLENQGRGLGDTTRQRKPPTWAEIMTKYDKNSDGLLSQEEFDLFRSENHPHRLD